MAASNITALADEDLVDLIQGPRPMDEKVAAIRVLEQRYQRLLCGRVSHGVKSRPLFLAAVKRGTLEDFCADVLGQAIRTYRRGKNAKFSTWVYEILTNEIISGKRLKKPPASFVGRDGDDQAETMAGASEEPGPLERLALSEALDLARACLAKMDERSRQVFVWGVLLEMTNPEIRDVWPHLTLDTVKKAKSRAAARFRVLWVETGGEKAEELLQNLGGAVAEKIDIDRIRSPRAREAFRLWVRKGSLPAAAKELKMDEERLRAVLREALHDLYDQGMTRGGATEAGLARSLELADPKDPLLERVRRTIDVVRAAFGLAPPDAAMQTLGLFLQRRLAREEDYDDACRILGLKPAALRKLLADQYEPEREFFTKLAGFLDVPEARLRALPRRPAGDTRLRLRSRAGFDGARFHARVMSWIPK